MKHKNIIALLCFSFTPFLAGVSIVSGSSTTAGQTFATAILSNAYHQPSRTWYTGMTNGNTTYTIGKVTGTGGFQSAVVNNTTTDNIRLLTLSHNTADAQKPLLIFSGTADNNTEPTLLYSQVAGDATRITVADATGTALTALNDANGTAATTASIRAIAAGNSYAFAAVKDTAATGAALATFGVAAVDDGIALMTINHTTKTVTIKDATTGADGNRALNIIPATLSITATPASVDGDVALHWDEKLQRLYVGMQATTAGTDDHVCYGLLIYRVGTNNVLTPVAPITTPAANVATINTKIIAAESGGTAASIALLKLGTMHTSTGLAYLIIQGGNNVAASVRNLVYSVPVVYTAADTGNLNGSLANIASATFGVGFATRADGFGDLYNSGSVPAVVGGGALPIGNAATTEGVSDMKVIGDTVYCATYDDTLTQAPGIYYSQAIFDDAGIIARWTDWAKAGPEALGNSATDGSAGHFAVDATNGTIMASDKATNTIVRRTAWTNTGTGTTSLVATLSSDFSDGCFSAFDLNQSTTNFGAATNSVNRYALFGGRGKVAFAKISTGATAAYSAAETVKTDFSDVDNYLLTTIAGDTAPVKVLGYSKWAVGASDGFFFAGTKNGFYVYCATAGGSGFTPTTPFADLDAAPFAGTFSWQKLTNIAGEPKSVKCIGNNVYILTRDTTKVTTLTSTTTTPTDRLYSLVKNSTTLAAINTATTGYNIIATSGTDSGVIDLSTATLFYDFEIISDSATGIAEQIILATNNGLYLSAHATDVALAVSQETALWAQISNPATNTKIYDHLIAPSHCRVPQKIWSTEWLDDSLGNNIWTFSGLQQLTSSTAAALVDAPDATFNSDSTTNFTRLSPITQFWSDGARRFYIGIPSDSNGRNNKLYTLPFNVGTSNWNLSSEQLLTDTQLTNHERFYWIQQIGATGNIMAGTEKDVISLE